MVLQDNPCRAEHRKLSAMQRRGTIIDALSSPKASVVSASGAALTALQRQHGELIRSHPPALLLSFRPTPHHSCM